MNELQNKMNGIIWNVANQIAERDDLIRCVAIALLSKKNLFILGDTGQAKSYVITQFCRQITGVRQFTYQVSKQTTEEQLFGRPDLSSLIPGSLPEKVLMEDAEYAMILVGTHDWDSAKSTLGIAQNVSEYSYMGGLNTAIQNIYAKNPNTKILLITPFFRSRIKSGDDKNSDDNTYNDLRLEDFADAMVAVANYNHIPCLNLYETSGINKFNSTAYLKDGLYPNDAGHELIADKILDAMNRFY